MSTDVDLAAVARLVAAPTRAAMLDALLSGQALAAGQLARAAGVSAATASEHLARLRASGWVEVSQAGRQRHYRLASPDVAHALESLAMVSPARPVRSWRQSRSDAAMAFARTCYDHLAGRVGVALHDALIADGVLVAGGDGYVVTAAGQTRLTHFGVDVTGPRTGRRMFACACFDVTERRPHLAGALGAALCAHMLNLKWFEPRGQGQRALRLTDAGRHNLAEQLAVTV